MSVKVEIDDTIVEYVRERLAAAGIENATDEEIGKGFGHMLFHMVGPDIIDIVKGDRERTHTHDRKKEHDA